MAAGYEKGVIGDLRYPLLRGAEMVQFSTDANRLTVVFEDEDGVRTDPFDRRARALFTVNGNDYDVRIDYDQGPGEYVSDSVPGMTADMVAASGDTIEYVLEAAE